MSISIFYILYLYLHLYLYLCLYLPNPAAALSKEWVCGPSLAGIAGSNPAGAWMLVCCEWCVLSGRSLCIGLITRREKSYRMWCVLSVLSKPHRKGGIDVLGLSSHEGENIDI